MALQNNLAEVCGRLTGSPGWHVLHKRQHCYSQPHLQISNFQRGPLTVKHVSLLHTTTRDPLPYSAWLMLSRYVCSAAHMPLAAAAKLCCLKDQCPARVSLQPLRDDACQTCQTVCDNLMATTPESQQGAHSSTVEENKGQALPQAVLSRFVAIRAGLSCPTNNCRHWQHFMIHQRHPQGHPYP